MILTEVKRKNSGVKKNFAGARNRKSRIMKEKTQLLVIVLQPELILEVV